MLFRDGVARGVIVVNIGGCLTGITVLVPHMGDARKKRMQEGRVRHALWVCDPSCAAHLLHEEVWPVAAIPHSPGPQRAPVPFGAGKTEYAPRLGS